MLPVLVPTLALAVAVIMVLSTLAGNDAPGRERPLASPAALPDGRGPK